MADTQEDSPPAVDVVEEKKTTVSDDTKDDGKFSFLILGGTGFIGRNLVEYLCANELANSIVVADKSMPITSYLNPLHKQLFDDHVTFKQSDLAKDDHVARVFDPEFKTYDYVINLCGETRFGLTDHDYRIRCLEPATKCSIAAAEAKVARYVEVSTAHVYAPSNKNAATEDSKTTPWTKQAKYRLQAEEKVKEVDGLDWVILRPAICYGVGDLTGLSPRIACAAVYQKIKPTPMKFLWTKGLHYNVVHVSDVCQAIWTACTELDAGTTYNLADQEGVTQGTLNDVLGELFDVKTGFMGKAISTAAKLNLSYAADTANDRHVPEWTRMCQAAGIHNTPITPYIDKELLYNNDLHINGEKIAEDSKFAYSVQFSKAELRKQIDAFLEQNIFPPVSLDGESVGGDDEKKDDGATDTTDEKKDDGDEKKDDGDEKKD